MSTKDAVQAAGIVGCGGAGFPTHVKIDTAAEVVIANGAECEPLLRVDRQLMQQYAADIVRGMQLVIAETGAKEGVIALKGYYEDAIAALTPHLLGTSIRLLELDNYYPSGDEQQIVYTATGRIVPLGGLPGDVGTVVCNVGTLRQVAQAVDDGRPVTEKHVTVGGAVNKPKTLLAPIGTPLGLLLEAAGGCTDECHYIIGGPCMGQVTESLDGQVVTKTTGGVLAFPINHPIWTKRQALDEVAYAKMRSICSQCNQCTLLCPRAGLGLGVAPHKAMRAVCWSKPELLGDADTLFGCCECGLCTTFACNFGLDPAGVMKLLRAQMAAAGQKPAKRESTGPVGWGPGKQVPAKRLIARLGIADYDRPAPMEGSVTPDIVCIPTKMHIGAPCKPIVREGEAVAQYQLIAVPQGLGANIHASIPGTVARVTPDAIEIRKRL